MGRGDKIYFILVLITLLSALSLQAYAESLPERQIQECACTGMQLEKRTQAGTFVDCVSETHVIEIDATSDWAQAIGQVLHYAMEEGKLAKILLFCEDDELDCLRHTYILSSVIDEHALPIEWDYVPESCITALR